MSIEQVPEYIARNKALAVRKDVNGALSKVILAADTVVVLHDMIIGKPQDRDDAIAILSRLSGKTHRVITGVVLLKGTKEVSFHDITEVDFHNLTREQLEYYVDNYRPYGKAGAYAIQEWIGVTGIKSIRGDFYNVMGLPVSRVVKTLAEFDFPRLQSYYTE